MTLSLPANRCTGHVILGLDRLTRHAAQMDREPELKIIRRAFAKQVMAAGGVSDPRVEAAFAAVAREEFLGPGPWQIVRWGGGYRTMPDPDPVYLYTDDVIGILPERNLNNGPVFSQLAGNLASETGSLETASSSAESCANPTSSGIHPSLEEPA